MTNHPETPAAAVVEDLLDSLAELRQPAAGWQRNHSNGYDYATGRGRIRLLGDVYAGHEARVVSVLYFDAGRRERLFGTKLALPARDSAGWPLLWEAAAAFLDSLVEHIAEDEIPADKQAEDDDQDRRYANASDEPGRVVRDVDVPCAECGRLVYFDDDVNDYRHLHGPSCALALAAAPKGAGWTVQLDAMDADTLADVISTMVLDGLDSDEREPLDELLQDVERIVEHLRKAVDAGQTEPSR